MRTLGWRLPLVLFVLNLAAPLQRLSSEMAALQLVTTPVAPGAISRPEMSLPKGSAPVLNATLTVTSLADSGAGSLRDTIAAAAAGDTINFSVTGAIDLTSGELVVNKALIIAGPGAASLTVRRSLAAGTPAFRVFEIQTSAFVQISGLTIANGLKDFGAGIHNTVSGGSLKITGCVLTGNQGTSAGGALNVSSTTTSITDSTFYGNSSPQGAAYNGENAMITVVNSTFTDNGAFALLTWSSSAAASATIVNSTIARNTGNAALWSYQSGAGPGSTVTLLNTLLADNTPRNAQKAGTGVFVSAGHNLDSDGTTGLVNGVNFDIVGTVANKINARLGSLQNSGGQVPTIPLRFSSAALDAGDDTVTGAPLILTVDTRGRPRNADGTGDGVAHVDIGALESQPYLVTNTNDSGANSLRQAILDNEAWGGGLIRFNIPGAGLQTITPLSALPAITRPVTVDGYTQPGSSPNTLAIGNNAVFGIQISGASFPGASAFALNGSDSTVRGFVINGFSGGQGASMGGAASAGNWVQGCFLGTNASGTAAVPNLRGAFVASGGKRNVVGTDSDGVNDHGERNLLSGNINEGIFLQDAGTDGNIVAGNYIGTNAAGMAAISNGFAGVNILSGATNNVIGGTVLAARNVISGNPANGGVVVQTASSTGNLIIGNYIGVDAAGTGPIPNVRGVWVLNVPQTRIGGPTTTESNLIAFNSLQGALITTGGLNTVQRNSIYSNGGLGIELASGANNGAVAPVLTFLSGGTVTGTLAGVNGESYRVEFFKNSACDPSRFGEGEVYLGSANTVPAGGVGSYSFGFAPDVSRPYISATATRVTTGDTSAFSACIPYGTSTAVTSSLNPAPFGATVTFTATVGNLVAGPTPSGSVQFVVDGTPLPPVATAGGLATLTTSSLLIGNHTVTASFSSAVGFASSSGSLAGGETINKASTTLSGLTDSPDPSVAGQPYTVGFILNVTAPGAGTPTGTVSVSDGSGGTCTATLPATSCSLTSPTFGPKTLTFSYSGDANFNTSVNQAGHQVNKASTTTTITSDPPDPSVVGQSVPIGVSVVATAPGAGTPTGNVTISNGTDICVTTVAVGACALTFMNTGGYTLTATYAGDSNFFGGTSAGEPHAVSKVDTTTTILSDNPDPSNVGQNVTVTWSVTVNPPGAIGLSGSVTVTDGVNSCLSGVGGSCSLALTTAGARTLTATYSGDSKANGSTSAGVPHTVSLANTTTSITADTPDPSVTGEPYTVTASVAVVPPGSGTPTGSVTVSDGTGGTCVLVLPATTCSLTSTTAGVKTLTATYSGDSGFNGSTSAGIPHTVNQASTVISGVSAVPEPSAIGQNYSVSFSLTVTFPGGGTPTGAVTVTDGAGGSCTATLPATACSLPSTIVGARSLSATYGGDSNFIGSSATGSHALNPATTTTVIASDLPDPSFIGQVIAVNYSVMANAPGSGTPTGTVMVTDGVNSCTGTVAAGTCGVALTTQGFRSLTASYVGTNETQAVTVGGAGGTFTLTFNLQTTPALAFNASAATVQAALQALSTVGPGNVTVISVASVYTVIFGGVLAGNTQPLMTAAGAGGATALVAAANPFAPSTSAIEPHSVATPPAITKAFAPTTVLLNQPSTLTITITNPAANPIGLTGIGVTDSFPAGVSVAAAPAATNTCGGTFTAVAGAASVSLTGGAIATPGTSCSVSVAVIATTSGTKNNVTDNVTSTEGGPGGTATATLDVIPQPTAVVSGTATICAGQSTALTAVLTGTTPWTVTWSDGVVQTVAASPATRTVSPTFDIIYTVTSLSDANYSNVTTGLTGEAVITVKPTPSSVITSAASVCFDSTGNSASVLDAGPGATYLWSVTGGTATSALNGTSIAFTAGASGNVILTATVSLNGCPSTSTKTVPIVQPPVAPVPTAPANGSTYQGGHVSWSHPGDASYDVYFDTVNPPARYLVTGLVNNFDAGIPVWFPGVTYYWQVVARNACGTAASVVQSFTGGNCLWMGEAPALLMPIANATNQNTTTTLVWTSVPGAARYDLYLGTSSTNGALYRSIPSPQLSATVSLAGGKTYYWKVVATPVCGASGSASSAVQSFTTAGNGFTLTSVTPGFVNRWESGQELSFTGSGFLATSRLFTDYRETEAGTLVPSVFLNSFSTSTNLFETLTPDAQAPAARYDVGVTNAGIEEGRLLQSLVVRTFTDVTENDWFFESSGRIADIGVMEQDIDSSASGPQFWPNTAVTRAQMAEYLAKGYQWWRTRSTTLPAASCTTPDFPDVPCSHPDWLAIHWIKTWGVTTGAPCASDGGNCYYPNNNLTRAEMLTFLERLRQATVLGSLLSTVGQTDPGCSQPYPGCLGWLDLPGGTTVQWPRAEFNVAYADRLTSGCGGTLGSLYGCPNDFVTRAQIGAFLARLLGLVPTP